MLKKSPLSPLLGLASIGLLLSNVSSYALSQDAAIDAAARKLSLTSVAIHHQDSYGQSLWVSFADGSKAEIDLSLEGDIKEIQGRHKVGIPEQDLRVLLPQAILDNPAYPSGAHIQKLELKDGYKVAIEGYGPGRHQFKAAFRHDGHLLEMKVEK